MYSKNCNHEISEDSRFFKYCGADLEPPVFSENQASFVQVQSKSKMPLYIGLGVVGLVVIFTCVFLIVHTLTDKEETTELSVAPTAQTQAETVQIASNESDATKASEGNTYNYYYYNTNGNPGSYQNSSTDGYLWPTDSAYITYSDLSYYSKKQVEAIRNEIYARHGYVFKTDEWSSYFNQRSWYSPNPNYSDSWLSSVERSNIDVIVQYEKDHGWK